MGESQEDHGKTKKMRFKQIKKHRETQRRIEEQLSVRVRTTEEWNVWVKQIKKTQDELQWIVAQRLLSALTIPGFS